MVTRKHSRPEMVRNLALRETEGLTFDELARRTGTYAGPDPSGAEWTQESLVIPAGVATSTSFQFNYSSGTSFTGDLAIDNFCIN